MTQDPPTPDDDTVPDNEATLEATDPDGDYPYNDGDAPQEDYS